ncbi:TPA: radical SAM protein [Clostridioides difficile]|nr:radical SAM protein [Clostridioides difficile]HBF2787048.1 radical SAM protein [Clostridioides difficile]HBF4061944.1 radical SAM protein [Clostridioides difficile]HBF6021741.1 radical SAM protein [Clostridioides difficile]HEK8843446.1 radical SAM protein [Clostridioides difficile]
MNFIFKESTKIMRYKHKVVLGNLYTGQWIRIPESVYKIFQMAIDNNLNLSSLKEFLYDDEDKKYIDEVYKYLFKIDVIHNTNCRKIDKNKIILFELTNRCNLKCKHCCIDSDTSENRFKDLNIKEIKFILDKIVEWNPECITLTGGEPMLRDDFFDILRYLRNKYSKRICILTNGTIINSINSKLLVELVDQIDISIDGIDEESCALVRGKDVFNKVINSIRILQNVGFNSISLSMVFGNKNSHLKQEFVNLNKKLNTYPIIREFKAVGRGEINKKIFYDKRETESVLDREFVSGEFRKKFNISSCSAGKKELYIKHNGDIYPCQAFLDEKYLIDNIMNIKSLHDLKPNSIKYHEFYKNFENDISLDNIKCKDCEVNLFCWPCPSEIKPMLENDICFEQTCKEIKPILFEEIWGETL